MRRLTAKVSKEDDMYIAECIEIGTISQGNTIENALKNLKEATELYLDENPSIHKEHISIKLKNSITV